MTISLSAHLAEIILKEQEAQVDVSRFGVSNDLSNHLLSNIDALLYRNRIDPLSLERVDFFAKDAGFTTTRIGETVANAYNFALKERRSER